MLRRPAVAGTWYPSDPARLTAEVESYLAAADEISSGRVPATATLHAIIAPHAGLLYSGPVAAHAYRLLRTRSFDSVVLIGPSHYEAFEGVSMWPEGAFATPLGDVPIDEPLAATLRAACPQIISLVEAHRREHSLEMQLPFLVRVAPGVPIVPLVMGHQTRDTAHAIADALVSACHGRRVLVVASSDLSHYFNAEAAAALDRDVIDDVERLDADGLMTRLERRPEHACGGGPIVSVLRAARALGAKTSRVINYADSGDVSGDKSAVVGYLAAAIWQ